MIKITKVKRQAKKTRYNLYEKNEIFICAVAETTLIKFNLFVGTELTSEKLAEIITSDTQVRAYQSALNYLSYAIKSEYEIKKKLLDLGFTTNITDSVINKLKDKNLLNDLVYAKEYVRTKTLIGTDGPIKLRNALMKKQIATVDIEDALAKYPVAKQLDNGKALVEKLNYRYRKEAVLKKRQKIYQQLLMKGYPTNIIDKLLVMIEQDDSNAELNNLLTQANKLWTRNQKYADNERRLKTKLMLANRGFKFDMIEEVLDKLN